jgi:hypothetical protein
MHSIPEEGSHLNIAMQVKLPSGFDAGLSKTSTPNFQH